MATQERNILSGLDSDSSGGSDFFNKAFDAVAKEALSFYHVPGLAIGVIHKGKTIAKVWQAPCSIEPPQCLSCLAIFGSVTHRWR